MSWFFTTDVFFAVFFFSLPTHSVTNTVSPNVHTYMIEALALEARLDFEASRPRWRCSALRSLPNVQTIASSTCRRILQIVKYILLRWIEREMERFGQRSAILMMDRSSLLGMILGYKTPKSSSTWGPREGEIVPSAPPLAARQYFQLGHFGSLKCHFWTKSKLCRDQLAGRTDGKLQQLQLPIVDLPRKSTTHEEPTTKTQN